MKTPPPFNKVSNKRLIWKLKPIGELKYTTKEWVKYYLDEREMRAVIRDVKSERRVTSGGQQGTNNVLRVYELYAWRYE